MKKFILLTLLLIIPSLTLTGCQKQENQISNQTLPQAQTNKKTSEESFEIKIIDGNINRVNPDGQSKIIIDKNNFREQAISDFFEVKVSPDKSRICFLGHSVVPIWLYWADIDGRNITKIDIAKNCVWSADSRKIAYNNHTTDVSPVDVFVYNLTSGETKNLTKEVSSQTLNGSILDISNEILRLYELPAWSVDDQQITSKYSNFYMNGSGKKEEGTSIIDLATGKITEK